MVSSIIITELLIVLKFDWLAVTKPIPLHLASLWLVGQFSFVLWTAFKFYTSQDVTNTVKVIW